MDITKKQAEFWGILIFGMTLVAITVLFIDVQIKTSILEESNRLRLLIEGETVGRNAKDSSPSGASNEPGNHADIPSVVLLDNAPGMETRNASNGATVTAPGTRKRRNTQPKRPGNAQEIPPGN
jgi:hypothetical protein